jgi:hypothetical protein
MQTSSLIAHASRILAMAVTLAPAVAHADPPGRASCPVPAGADPELEEVDPQARLRFISTALHADASNTRLWNATWVPIGLAVATGNGIAAGVTSDWSNRAYFLAGVGNGLITPALILLNPLRAPYDAEAVDHMLAWPDACDALARGEALLSKDAEDERSRVSWYMHVVPLAFNVAVVTGIGLGVGHWQQAVAPLVAGSIAIEAQLWTVPQGSRRAMDDYRAGRLTVQAPASAWHIVPLFTGSTYGLAVAGEL